MSCLEAPTGLSAWLRTNSVIGFCSESKALSNHNLSIKLGAMSTLSAIAAAVLLVSSNGIVGIVAAGGILCLLAIATIVNAVSGPKSP